MMKYLNHEAVGEIGVYEKIHSLFYWNLFENLFENACFKIKFFFAL